MLANPISRTAKFLLIYNIVLCFVTVVSLIAFIVTMQKKSNLMENPSASFELALKDNFQLILVFAQMIFFNLFNAFYTGYLSRTEFLTDKGWDRLWKISIVFIAAQIAVTSYNIYRLVVLMLQSSKGET